MKKFILFISYFAGLQFAAAQNPATIIIPNPTPNPPVLASDSYTRATSGIKLQNGFKYGFVSGSATNLLNLNISSYPNYVNNNYNNVAENPGYNTPNSNAVVGITEGSGNVTSIGAFQYNIPIKCSPGTAGMQPALAISYNSSAANSWLGVGFNLTGISSINRTSKTVFYDGLNGRINFDSSDVFSLDGERLLLLSGVYGQPGATYKLETEVYNKITSYGTQGSGPKYFIINTRDGRTIEYGLPNTPNTVNSANTAKNSNEILNWCINKVTDEFGNYMTYNYVNTDGEILIDKIEYTGNVGFNPYNKISFSYIDRSDNNSFFAAGKEFTRKKLLKRVTCTDLNNHAVSQYDLDYEYNFASFLNKITETDALGNSLNPTFIEWSKNQVTVPEPVNGITVNAGNILKSIAADMDGDGFQDIVNIRNPSSPEIEIKLNTGNINLFPSISNSMYVNKVISGTPITILATYAFDEDDDNIDEVFIIYSGESSFINYYQVVKLKFNGSAYDLIPETSGTNLPQNGLVRHWVGLDVFGHHINFVGTTSGYFYTKQDISGDDKRDVILSDQYNILITPSNAQPQLTFPVPNLLKTELGDFDGDGVMEIYALTYTSSSSIFNIKVYRYNNTLNTLDLITTYQVDIGSNQNMAGWNTFDNSLLFADLANAAKSISFSDMDGDGKTDIFFVNYNNAVTGLTNCVRSNGLGFITDPAPALIPLTLNSFESAFFTADINNDGKSDLVATSYNPGEKSTNYAYYNSNGNGLINTATVFNFYDKDIGVMGDFNADGLLDYAYQKDELVFSHVAYSMFSQDNKRMVNHIFNLKSDYKIYYQFLNNSKPYSNGLYQKMPSANSTNFKISRPRMFVVLGTDYNYDELKRYGYENGLIHEGKKGFLGFEKIYTYNPNNPGGGNEYMGSCTSYKYDDTYDYIFSMESITGFFTRNYFANYYYPFLPVQSKLSGKIKTDFLYVATGTNRYLLGSETKSRDYLASTNTINNTTYDNSNSGNVLSSLTTAYPWSGGAAMRSDEMRYYYTTSGVLPITRLTQARTINSAGGNSAEYHTDYNYDGAGHLKTKITNSNFPALAVTTTFDQFNIFGSPASIVVTAPDLLSRAASVLYDNTGRFITKTTNAIGNSEESTYEPGMGNQITHTDISGLVSTYTYDGMGRLILENLPNNIINTISYQWYNYPLPPNPGQYAIKVIRNLEATGPATVFYDNKDNIIREEAGGFNGAMEIAESTYDVLNRLSVKTSTHYQNQLSYTSSEYHYDEYSRPETVREMLNQTEVNKVTYAYNALSTESLYNKGFATTITKNSAGNGSSYVTKENNEAGQVDKVINYGGNSPQQTAKYVFNEHNQPSSISTAFPNGEGNAVTTILYDDLGRKNNLKDPSAGVSTYTYNSIGELIKQTTPEGTYTYVYDLLGRLAQKTGSGQGTTNYSYATAANGRQQAQAITGPLVATEYTYDNLGRVTEFKETLNSPNKIFKTNFTYDKYSRILNYTYPNGFVTTNEYDNAGMLVKIKNNNDVLWQLNAMLTPALPAQYTYKNGLTTNIQYDVKLNIKEINAGSLSRQSYTINNDNGDLLNRAYINYSLGTENNESFDYDAFDRLSEVNYLDDSHNTLNRANYSYAPNGNISYKTDCGDYTYGNSAKPYDLTQIDNLTGNVSLNHYTLAYTDFKKISQLTDATANKQFNFGYGNDENRIKMDYLENSQAVYTRYYQPNYDREERNSHYREWSYVYAPTGLCAVNYKTDSTQQMLYVTTDNLGSPVLLTGESQEIVEENSFDPWGRKRDPADWNNAPLSDTSILIRGFQMHEMLHEVGIINMNGRIYDPVIGRFLQPDVVIQDPGNLQNFNRYAYCFNNPLKYTDPSGYIARYVEHMGTGTGADNNAHSQTYEVPVYVDGFRYSGGTGGAAFWAKGGGAGSISTTQNFGVWTGHGPGLKNATISRGALLDYGSENKDAVDRINGSGAYIQMRWIDNGLFVNPFDGRTAMNYEDAALMQWTEVGQSSSSGDWNTDMIDKIAGGIGVNMDFKEGLIEIAQKTSDIGGLGEKYLKFTKLAGKFMGYTSAAIAWKDYNKKKSTGNFIKAISNTGLAFLRINPFVGVGLGILDLTGASDKVYNEIGNRIDNFKK